MMAVCACHLVWLILTSITFSLSQNCPMECTCNPAINVTVCNDPDISSIPSGLPSGEFKSLAISGTKTARFEKFTHLARSSVVNAKTYKKLIISFTSLSTIDTDAFQDLKALLELKLTDNKLSRLNQGTFDNLPKLLLLDVSGNEYCKVDPGTFSNIGQSLHFLRLGDLRLGSLDPNSFQHLTALNTLDLEGNDLRKLHKNLLAPLTSLKSLDLAANKLKGLPEDNQPILTKLDHLDLTDNPWQCNCALDFMRNVAPVAALKPGSHLECYGPERLQFQTLTNIPSSSLLCVNANITCDGPISVKSGESITIKCKVMGDPEPDITWTLPNSTTLDEDHEKTGYKMVEGGLVVDAGSKSDDGKWTVTATNVGGPSTTVVEIHVKEEEETTTQSTTTTTIGVAAEEGSMLFIIIGAAAGGSLLLLFIILILCIRHKKKKDEVKPFNNEDSDDEHELTTRRRKNIAPHGTKKR